MTMVANPYQSGGRSRSSSFAGMDEAQASGILEDIIRDNQVYLGGSSIGKGFNKAALKYIDQKKIENEDILKHPDLNTNLVPDSLVEESFYVVDIGIIVSQVYQWRKCFPRVEPFYAVKCNPDPVIIKTLALLGCNFDCASATEIDIVQSVCHDLRTSMRSKTRETSRLLPEIVYANPCKSRKHIIHAVTKGVTMTTFDNVSEVIKCASISNKIQLVLRIVTDDTGSQCRLSSKYGAPKARWRNLLKVAQQYSMQVVGVSFHVGSGCHDASRYFQALRDARELFDIAKSEFGFDMKLLDIGGGFPGETYSFWNPEVLDKDDDKDDDSDDDDDSREGLDNANGSSNDKKEEQEGDNTPYMFFLEIAEQVAPMIDELFPPDVRVIGEPGRYFVAAAATLVTSIVGSRSNEIDQKEFAPEAISDAKASAEVYERSRKDEHAIVRSRGRSFDDGNEDGASNGTSDGQEGAVWDAITEELGNYAKFYTKQNFVTQETDAYNDGLDLYNEDFDTAADLLGIPDKDQMKSMVPTVEGMSKTVAVGESTDQHAIISLAGAGEAAVSGMVLQAVADSAPLQDDYAYYVNDGVYGAFNNLMFDHATVRPRVLRIPNSNGSGSGSDDEEKPTKPKKDQDLFASTVFGPTCDSIDVITRSVLLPKLKIGDWLYFQNMGAYTMAAASSFNGFVPSDIMYVCSVQPEYFEGLIAGPADETPPTTKTTSKAPDDDKHTAGDEEKKIER